MQAEILTGSVVTVQLADCPPAMHGPVAVSQVLVWAPSPYFSFLGRPKDRPCRAPTAAEISPSTDVFLGGGSLAVMLGIQISDPQTAETDALPIQAHKAPIAPCRPAVYLTLSGNS